MPDYSILITKTAQKQLDKLPVDVIAIGHRKEIYD
jgi:mRNA-degrading endonuclease RelE of RelBE toxin-antitoxin system